MNLGEFNRLSNDLLETARAIRDSKRKSYAPDVDVLANFKTDGERAKVGALGAWRVHFYKQLSAIESFMDHGHESEPIKSRFADAINYLLLGYALLHDRPMFGEDLHD